MKRAIRWVLIGLAVLLAAAAAAALAARHWLGTDDFRNRVAQQASQQLGVPVQIGALAIDFWPLPAVAAQQVRVQSQPPLVLERIEARPSWAALLQRRVEITTLVVRNAVVPERAVDAILASLRKKQGGQPKAKENAADAAALLPRRTVLDHVTWTPAKGSSMTVNVRAELADDALPQTARIEVVQGHFAGAKATLDRQARDRWALKLAVGGGEVKGILQLQQLQQLQGGASKLQGQLVTANVEVSALTAPSKSLTGRIEAHTALAAEFRELGGIADAMQTQTKFVVHNAVLHGIDLAQAVKTVGMNRGGQTALDTLAGNVTTRGRAVHLTNLVATSGVLSANGDVAMAADKSLNGRVTVVLAKSVAGGAVGVPLAVGGTAENPSVTLSRSALVGAAIGTMLAPGVGTGAGAKAGDSLGDKLKGLFGK